MTGCAEDCTACYTGEPDDAHTAMSRSDQLIDCVVKKVAVEASLHSAQMLLLDFAAWVEDMRNAGYFPTDDLAHVDREVRHYLMTSRWVLPPDPELLGSLSLSRSPEEVALLEGEASGATSDGETVLGCGCVPPCEGHRDE